MKKTLTRYLFLLISLGIFSTKLFAQAPLPPGDDPMKADSAKYIVVLKPISNNQPTSRTDFLPAEKEPVILNEKSDNVVLGKKEEEKDHIVF